MQTRGGIFIPDQFIHLVASAVFLVGVLLAVLCAVYYLWRGLYKIFIWYQMSKVEKAKAFLRKYDPEFRRQAQVRTIMRQGQPRTSHYAEISSPRLQELFRGKKRG